MEYILFGLIKHLRFSSFILLSFIGLVSLSVVCLLFFYLPNNKLYRVAALWAPYVCWLMRIVLGVSITVRGTKYIPAISCIIAPNHQTPYDGIIFDNILPKHSYVAKRSVANIPLFGWLFTLTRPIYIDRNQKRRAMRQIVRKGMKRMAGGSSIIIFPEGKRSFNGRINKYKKGCSVLSWSSRRAILPIYHNAFNCFSRSGKYKGSGNITVTIGRPIFPQRKSVNAINELLFTWVKHKEFSNKIT